MPAHASPDHRFLGLDGVEWLLTFGIILMLGVIVTLSYFIDHSINVVAPPSASSAEFI